MAAAGPAGLTAGTGAVADAVQTYCFLAAVAVGSVHMGGVQDTTGYYRGEVNSRLHKHCITALARTPYNMSVGKRWCRCRSLMIHQHLHH